MTIVQPGVLAGNADDVKGGCVRTAAAPLGLSCRSTPWPLHVLLHRLRSQLGLQPGQLPWRDLFWK